MAAAATARPAISPSTTSSPAIRTREVILSSLSRTTEYLLDGSRAPCCRGLLSRRRLVCEGVRVVGTRPGFADVLLPDVLEHGRRIPFVRPSEAASSARPNLKARARRSGQRRHLSELVRGPVGQDRADDVRRAVVAA